MEKKSFFGNLFGGDKDVAEKKEKEQKEFLKPRNTRADDLYYQSLMQNGVENPKPPADLSKLKAEAAQKSISGVNPSVTSEDVGYTQIFPGKIPIPGIKASQLPKSTYHYQNTLIPKYKPTKKVKMVVVLVEESTKMNEFVGKANKIISKYVSEDSLICILRSGKTVSETDVLPKKELALKERLIMDGIKTEDSCFYDAILRISELVEEYRGKKIEKEKENLIVEGIEIFGVGTGTDNCSKATVIDAMKAFKKILKMGIITKYFCVNEIYMPGVATIGFRSIGSMSSTY